MKARYRRLTDPETALARLLEKLGPPGSLGAEEIPVEAALDRITAGPVAAALSCPPYHAAAMDGIAVVSARTAGASPTAPLLLGPTEAQPIDTGDPMPEGFDAVIPVEQIGTETDGRFSIQAAASARQHVRLCGEDLVAGEMILPGGRRLGPAHIGALLSAGVTRVLVRKRPRVAILPTGDELCEPGEDPSDGRVIESNSRMLAAYLLGFGAQPIRLPGVPDDPAALAAALRSALEGADVALVLAGSSAGRDDHTPGLIASLGELVFHGLGLMPGKPTAAGIALGKPVIGVPGFPVSAAVVAERLLRPLVAHLLGSAPPERQELTARLARNVPSRPGVEEVLRVVLGRIGGTLTAAPLGRGAGTLSTLTRAHGLIRVPAAREGLPGGSEVAVELLVTRHEVEQSLLLAGSNDLALSVLDDLLGARAPGASLNVAPLGSLGGLAALGRSEAHLAGTHLLDPATGEYNLKEVALVLPGRAITLVTLAHRQQGLCLRPDDPRRPTSLAQVAREGLRFVNRQAGSGTRVLTDHLLSEAGLAPVALRGYDHEEFTHVAVAQAVQARVADCGLLIAAAARALGLRFVPICEERYDLVIPAESLEDERIVRLLSVLESAEFRNRMVALGGYDPRETGVRRSV